jgi:hypothetical protein
MAAARASVDVTTDDAVADALSHRTVEFAEQEA